LVRELPKIVASEIDPPDLTQLGQLISSTAGAGMQWFPDPELEKFIRDIARLPEMPDEVLEMKRQQAMQEQAMGLADSQMQMLGLQQKAELTAEGYSPEQAQMIGESPTPEMQQYQMQGDLDMQDQQLQMQQKYAMADDPAAQAQHSRDNEAFARDQKGADADLKREAQRLKLQQQHGKTQLQMEKEKAKLNERGQKSKVQLEGMKGKVGLQSEKEKLKLEAQRAKLNDSADQSKFKRQMEMLRAKSANAQKAPGAKSDGSKKGLPGKVNAAAKKTAKKAAPKKKGR
jgi:hypothetical protein